MRFFSTLVASILGTLVALALLIFLGSVLLSALVAMSGSTTPSVRSGTILEVRLAGTVPEIVSADPLAELLEISPSFDLVGFRKALRKAASDDRIEGVWLKARGLSAPWSTLQEIRQALLEFKESGKPIVASSGESFVTERDYFISSVADEVFAAPGAFFEFNGLYAQTFYYKGMLDKLRIEPTIVRAGAYKSAVEPYTRTSMSDESRLQLASLLETHNSVLTAAIAEGRDTTVAYVERLMQEDAFITAEDALHAGLLDELIFDDTVEEKIKSRTGISGDLKTVRLRSYAGMSGGTRVSGNEGTIAVVYAVGIMISGKSSGSGAALGSTTFTDAMDDVRENDDVKAIVLRINSPGGSALAADAMWHSIDQARQKKPVIVSMGDLAASGGYWIATAGDTIVADPTTITGSIGVFGMHFSMGEMLETKLGVTNDRVATSAYADMFSGLRPLRPAEQTMLERLIDSTYTDFLTLVSASRGLEVGEVHNIAQGRVWTGRDAMEIGLVDVLGGLDTAIQIAAARVGLEEGSYRLRRLPRPKTFMQELEDALMVRAGRVLGLDAPPLGKMQVRQHLDLLEEAIQMQGVPRARMPMEITIE